MTDSTYAIFRSDKIWRGEQRKWSKVYKLLESKNHNTSVSTVSEIEKPPIKEPNISSVEKLHTYRQALNMKMEAVPCGNLEANEQQTTEGSTLPAFLIQSKS
jgi:hypothetical protein